MAHSVEPAGTRPAPRGALRGTDAAATAAVALLALAAGAALAAGGAEALVLGLALAVVALLLFDFRIGVGLLIVLMPVSGSALFPHAMFGVTGLNPLNLLLAATLASWVLHGLHERRRQAPPPLPLACLLVLPMLLAGALGTQRVDEIVPGFYAHRMIEFHDAAGYLRDLLAKPLLMVVYALLVAAAVARTEQPQRLLLPALASVWITAAMAVLFVLAGDVTLAQLAGSDQREFLSPLGLHGNELGRLYVFAYALLLFGRGGVEQAWMRVALALSLLLVVAALLLTFSRSAFVGLIVVSAMYLLWRRPPLAVCLLWLAVATALFVLPTLFSERLSTGFGAGLDAISAGRIQGLWLPLLSEVQKSPLWGQGLGSILWSEAMHRSGGGAVLGVTHPHSAYLQALLDMGILGLLLLLAYYAHVARGLRRLAADTRRAPALRGFAAGALAGLVSFLVGGLVDSSLLPKPEHALLWFSIGVLYGLQARPQGSAP